LYSTSSTDLSLVPAANSSSDLISLPNPCFYNCIIRTCHLPLHTTATSEQSCSGSAVTTST
jgi:hypothetical protein